MEIAIVNGSSLRLKTKTCTLLVDSQDPKMEADAAIFLNNNQTGIKGVRLNITGPGEFEIGGVKITSVRLEDSFFYLLDADRVKVGLGKMSTIDRFHDKLDECDVALINVDSPLNMASVSGLEPKITVLYPHHEEFLKSIGKEIVPVAKLVVLAEKLPTETQTFVLK